MPRRLVFDLSSLARWVGTPGGLVRAQREIALRLRAHAPQTVFAIFDPHQQRHRLVAPRYLEAFLDGAAALNAWGLPDANAPAWARMPPALQLAGRPRRAALTALEGVRLRGSGAAWADRLQRAVMQAGERHSMVAPDGERRAFPSSREAMAGPVAFRSDDVLVCAGWWAHLGIDAVLKAKARHGFRVVVLCYDLIPLVLPEFFPPEGVAATARWWRTALAGADLVAVNAAATARDIRAFCESWRVAPPRIGTFPLGANPLSMRGDEDVGLPAGLNEGSYALFVSTLAPHKGHALLLGAWLDLLEEGVPQAAGFKLVFVGRPGWQKGPLETQLQDPRLTDWLVRLNGIEDATLDALYRKSAFCLHPSLYEGYGLPIVEAFARGKAVLASDGGSLPEVVGDFSPILPGRDVGAWRDALRAWIQDPGLRAPYERAIRERFSHLGWDEAAARFFALIDEATNEPIA